MIPIWTEERIERLQELRSLGFSAAQIAAELGGVTRNAVLGKCHRMSLPAFNPVIGSKPKRQHPPMQPRIRDRVVTLRPPTIRPERKRLEPFAGLFNLQLSELGRNQCRWIEGDSRLFCGNQTEDGVSWCDHHRSICFAKPSGNRVAGGAS